MTRTAKRSRWVCAVISVGLLILAGIPAQAAPAKTRDPFIGEWLLSVHSAQGQQVSRDEITVALKISEAGSFYNVALDIPISSRENEYGGFSWVKFTGQSDKSLKNLTESKAKRKYAGEYLMDIDGRSIAQQNGSVTFVYKAKTGMLCEAGLGCFSKGNQSALIKRYTEQQRANAKARAEAEAEARAGAKARAEASAEARARAVAESKAAAEAIARRPRSLADVIFAVPARHDKFSRFELEARNRIDFRVALSGGGEKSALRAVLLTEDGYSEWQKLEYKSSGLFGRKEKQNTDQIEGPCSDLLRVDVTGEMSGSCVLDAGTYYIVFYDAWNSLGDRSLASLVKNEVTASLDLTAQPAGPAGNSGSARPPASEGRAKNIVARYHPLIGTWRGMVDQSGASPYGVRIHFMSPGQGSAEYPSTNCATTLSGGPTGSPSLYKYRETITSGRCANSMVTVEVVDDRTITCTWVGGGATASATLAKD